MTDIVDRLRTVDISWSQQGEWCAEAADEIIKLREDKKLAFELMDTLVKEINRLKQEIAPAAIKEEEWIETRDGMEA